LAIVSKSPTVRHVHPPSFKTTVSSSSSFSILKTSSYLYFKDGDQVIAQVKTIISTLSIVNPVALAGASITTLFAFCSAKDVYRNAARVSAGGATVFVLVAFASEIAFIAKSSEGINSAGVGFWFTVISMAILASFACFAGCIWNNRNVCNNVCNDWNFEKEPEVPFHYDDEDEVISEGVQKHYEQVEREKRCC
jgi:hypothetical protein